MHRYCQSFMDDEEKCKRQGTPTPSTREVWKRRCKKKSFRRSSSERTSRQHRTTGPSQRQDVRPPPDKRHIYTRAKSVDNQRPDDRQLLDVRCHLNRAKVSGSPATPGRPDTHEPPDDRNPLDVWYLSVHSFGPEAHVPLHFTPICT